MYQEHNSWQGIITHLETGEEYTFRSTPEMLLLMNAILKTGKNDTAILKQRRYQHIHVPEIAVGI